jgi:hypothetical protein
MYAVNCTYSLTVLTQLASQGLIYGWLHYHAFADQKKDP